jgi:hypothetical protein
VADDDLRFAGAEDVDVADALYPVIGLPPSLDGGAKLTLTEVGPVGVATIDVTGPGAEIDTQGSPVQFSKAAFFQRTLISSRLNEAFRFISLGEISLDNNSLVGFCPFKFTCTKQITGSSSNDKILNIILML